MRLQKQGRCEVVSKRKYTDAEKGAALAFLDFKGGNVRQAAEALKIPHKTLDEWAKGRINEDSAEIRTDKKEEIAELINAAVTDMIGASTGKLADANLQQVWTSVGIAVDKMQLLKGEATTITKELMSGEDRELIKRELRQKLSLVKSA